MDEATQQVAWIGLIGVAIGSFVTLVASAIIPWIRDVIDRRRVDRERIRLELRDALLRTLAELLAYRQAKGVGGSNEIGKALARFGAANNELTVRLSKEQQPVADVILAMLAMVQAPTHDVANMVGEAMQVLTEWIRGDLAVDQVIPEVETRAGVRFSADRKTVGVVRD